MLNNSQKKLLLKMEKGHVPSDAEMKIVEQIGKLQEKFGVDVDFS